MLMEAVLGFISSWQCLVSLSRIIPCPLSSSPSFIITERRVVLPLLWSPSNMMLMSKLIFEQFQRICTCATFPIFPRMSFITTTSDLLARAISHRAMSEESISSLFSPFGLPLSVIPIMQTAFPYPSPKRQRIQLVLESNFSFVISTNFSLYSIFPSSISQGLSKSRPSSFQYSISRQSQSRHSYSHSSYFLESISSSPFCRALMNIRGYFFMLNIIIFELFIGLFDVWDESSSIEYYSIFISK